MALFVLAYFAGALTIRAPCILPVLPFVFARAGHSFLRNGLPILVGMAVSFAAVATLASIGAAWAADLNQWGRGVAMAMLAILGVTLAWPAIAERMTRPLVALGNRLSDKANRQGETSGSTVPPAILLGVATGLLWSPCAGPVLGLVLTTAALQGASARSTLLLLSYAAGAATTLGLALWIGGRLFRAMTRSLGVSEWLRRGLGVAVIAGVSAVAFGWDTALLARLPSAGNNLEQSLLDRIHGAPAPIAMSTTKPDNLQTNTAAAAQPEAAPLLTLPVEGHYPSCRTA